MNTPPRILIAGIGNIFLGDDAFGCQVAHKLMSRARPDGVRVVDFGIRGIDLIYALMDGCDLAILIDAVPRGDPPGTLYLIEPQPAEDNAPLPLIEGHSLDPAKVLALVRASGTKMGRVLLVGCEPSPIDPQEDIQMELSPPVRAAIEPAIAMVESLVAKLIADPSEKELHYAHV